MKQPQRNIAEDILGKGRTQSINQKRKGNTNEREAAKALQEWTGEEFVRVPQSGGIRWKNSENVTGDIMCTKRSFKFPFSVETKHLKSLAFVKTLENKETLRANSQIFTYWSQAESDAKRAGKAPLMLIRCNGMAKGVFYLFIPAAFRMYVACAMKNPIQPVVVDNLIIGYDSAKFFACVDHKKFCTFVKKLIKS